MARESTTVQCYPSDEKVNEMVRRYESFGWELIGNQNFQEFTGQSSDGDTITNHYSTYNKLTFSRETSGAWYAEVTALERKHDSLLDDAETYEYLRPEHPKLTKNVLALFSILFIASFVGMFLLSLAIGFTVAPLLLLLSPILMIITAIVRNVKYKRAYDAWFNEYYDKIKKLEKDAENIRKQARALLSL